MKIILEVDLDAGAVADDPGRELGRILRYWGSVAKDLDLTSACPAQDVYDSTYTVAGSWRLDS